jgi:hypothetical protein
VKICSACLKFLSLIYKFRFNTPSSIFTYTQRNEELYILRYNAVYSVENQSTLRTNESPLPSAENNKRSKKLLSIRGDKTVNVNKPSPVSPQVTARSGQSAQLVQGTHCIRTHVNLHLHVGHPCNGTPITWSLHDFILRAKKISCAFVYDDFLVSANGL